jgi:Helix-turn-helix domain
MNALAANDFEAADLHGSKVKTAESLGVSRATIYRKIHQYGIVTRPANRPCDPVPAQPQNGIMPPSPARNLPPEPAAAPSPATIQAPGPGPGTRRRAARPGNR